MYLQDHYRILGIEPSATLEEIKKAYRQLALKYHPDKTSHDPYATVQFTAIKEAYEVLTHPGKKQRYLQQRWYNQVAGKKKSAEPLTPFSALKQMMELERFVSRLDIHRMDKKGLDEYINYLLSNENIQQINSFDEPNINKEIAGYAVRIGRLLSYKQLTTLSVKLNLLVKDKEILDKMNKLLVRRKRGERWEKYKPLVLLLGVIIFCLLIYYLTS